MPDQLPRDSELLSQLKRALRYLAEHPHSSARTIAKATSIHARTVFHLLNTGAYDGLCQRHQENAHGPWLWEICPDGLSLIQEHEQQPLCWCCAQWFLTVPATGTKRLCRSCANSSPTACQERHKAQALKAAADA